MTGYAAPGKAVIWGEYAVLAGAPAMVMAVNRYATATVQAASDRWHIEARGFQGSSDLSRAELEQLDPAIVGGPAATLAAAHIGLGRPTLPTGADWLMDTRQFHHHEPGATPQKLGIGSSAAISTAVTAALADFLQIPFDPTLASTTHRALQGKSGSGLDVAAACHGGLIRFQDGSAVDSRWPDGLNYRFVWSGHPTKTTSQVARFNQWRADGSPTELEALVRASSELFDQTDMTRFADYVRCLKALDEAAGVGIYGDGHKRLDKLAKTAQVVYKPCGAGGGDIGIALSDDGARMDAFCELAARESFLLLDMEIAVYGVHRIRS